LPLDVAVRRLHLCTGHRWRARSLLILAAARNLRLLARVPAGIPTVYGQLDAAECALTPGQAMPADGFAALLPVHLHQLRRSGETASEYPEDFDTVQYVTRWFIEPVRVRLADVFVPHQALKEALEVWKAGKRGELMAQAVPQTVWYSIMRRPTPSQLKAIAHQTELRFVAANATWRHSIVLPAPPLPADQPFAGKLQAFEQLRPRALWLMDFFYLHRDEWAAQRRQKISKATIMRRVAGQLQKDGTHGPLGDRLSEATVTRLVADWVMPSASTLDDAPRRHRTAESSWIA
jgi:hypothetical protein